MSTPHDNVTFDTIDDGGERGSQQRINAAVPSYRQATTTYRAPEYDAGSKGSNPSYRVATDVVVAGEKRSKDKPPSSGGFWSEHKLLILIVLCIALFVLCIILLALAINYGVLYNQKSSAQPSTGAQIQAIVQDPNQVQITTTTTAQPTTSGISVSSVVLGMMGTANVTKYVLTNANGMQAQIISHGARINVLKVPSSSGALVDVVLGSDDSNITNFQQSLFGAVNGRVCSSIKYSFSYNGVSYTFNNPKKVPSNYVDGGADGFYTRNYEVSYVDAMNRVHFVHNGSSADDNLPGNFNAHVIYQLKSSNELMISMTLDADATTPVDMCSSVRFNLAGEGTTGLTGHSVQINSAAGAAATAYDPSGSQPSSSILGVQYQSMNTIDAAVNYASLTSVYDLTYKTPGASGKINVATARNSATRIQLDIFSNQPAVRFYIPSMTSMAGKNNSVYSGFSGFTLQPQQFPVFSSSDSSVIAPLMLSSSGEYRQETSYKFSTF